MYQMGLPAGDSGNVKLFYEVVFPGYLNSESLSGKLAGDTKWRIFIYGPLPKIMIRDSG
jgi:hypothetical protein